MARRRREEPDKRLDWRDPEMPVLRRFENNFGEVTIEPVSSDDEQAFHQDEMRTTNPGAPPWDWDPTYDIARRKRRR